MINNLRTKGKGKNKIHRISLTFLIAKLIFLYLAMNIIGLSNLGDSSDYLSGHHLERQNILSPAYLMSVLGNLSSSVFGYGYLSNIPLLLISWYGIIKPLSLIEASEKQKVVLLIALLSPSYLIWSSLHSKEAVMNFILGILTYYFILVILKERLNFKSRIIMISLFLLLSLFKPFYVPAFFWLFLFSSLIQKNKFSLKNSITMLLTMSILLLLALMYNYETLNKQAIGFQANFSTQSNLTRTNLYWNSASDLLLSIPHGIFMSFIGPTIQETSIRIDLLFVFIESIFQLVIISYLLYKSCIRNNKLNLQKLIFLGGFLLLILLAHFPFGYFNPGSAIRYKQSFYPIIVILFFFFAFDKRTRIYQR